MKVYMLMVLILLSGCSIIHDWKQELFYKWETDKQEILNEFVIYIYNNKEVLNEDDLKKNKYVEVEFHDLKFLNTNNLITVLNKYPNGIELCNKYRDIISFDEHKPYKMFWLYYHVKETNMYFCFTFVSDLNETNYKFVSFKLKERVSCDLKELQRVIVVPE